MSDAYRTLYQCTTCNSVLDVSAPTLDKTTCACGKISIKTTCNSETETWTEVQIAQPSYVKHRDVEPKRETTKLDVQFRPSKGTAVA